MKASYIVGLLGLVVMCLCYMLFSTYERGSNTEQNFSINSNAILTCPGKLHVLVTGGAGYIGSHATLRLLQAGHCVTVVDNFSRGHVGAINKLRTVKSASFRFVYVDLGDKERVVGTLRASKPPVDLVMHFAAVASVAESVSRPLVYYHNITGNTILLMEAMQEAGVKKLVYSSTCAVYGNPRKVPVTEETPVAPVNAYARSKLYAEQAIRDWAKASKDFNAVILRYFNVYGSDPDGLLGEWPKPDLREIPGFQRITGACLDAAQGLAPELLLQGTTHPTEDGTTIRDYIHVEDIVSAHLMGMGHATNPPSLYNVGTGQGTSVRQFIDACKKVTGKPIKVVEQKAPRAGDYATVFADPTKIKKDLQWRPEYTDVEVGLGHAWRWREANPAGYD